MILKDSAYYEGLFNNNKIEGYGRLIDKETNYYEGKFLNN